MFIVSETNFTLCVTFILRNVPRMCFAKSRCLYDTSLIVYVLCCVFVYAIKSLGVGAGHLQ